ncbi:MAG TPA: glycosyltransferase family 39 protein [Solirubrobacteraceae bacterium]|nr:glycosyltransferase family 39 protein [Solirubrobacteraceae bacterium]
MSYSWETQSAAAPAPAAPAGAFDDLGRRARERARALASRRPHPELAAVMALAAALNLWELSRNGFANDYYAAAVRSMSASWHDFLFASMDRAGVMTVDKPPLALWVQALSVRVFGYHPLSILVPQALMGVATVALMYDLVRRRFGRLGGFVAALALALTPITVAISRHNNPDALLVLCCVAALWCTVRAFEAAPRGRAVRWLVAAGALVGLGFETKMLVALVVVPGIAAAWLWAAPAARTPEGAPSGARARAAGRLRALGQLLAGGTAMLVVGGVWPLLVELTPASDRPWVSGTSSNTIWSLIFEYNGLGRVDGQAGGPGGVAGSVFGGATGPFRLLNSALGGQAGWLLGFALVSGVAILAASGLRRSDPRSGWLIAVGGAFATTAVLFSFASGIFHPYYVSLLAPFSAALVGAGAAQLMRGRVNTRVFGPLAVAGGVATELVVLGDYGGQLRWLVPILLVVGLLAALALAAFGELRARGVAVLAALASLLIAPGVWAFDTLGHATNGTFPEGGPSSALASAGGPGGFGGRGGRPGSPGAGGPGGGFAPAGAAGVAGAAGAPSVTGASGTARVPGAAGALGTARVPGSTGAAATPGASSGGKTGTTRSGAAGAPQLFGSGPTSGSGGLRAPGGSGARGGALGAPMGASVSSTALSYVKHHGGGTIAVESQSNAASAIVRDDAEVAGIGGFSGRESDVSVSWLAQEVRAGKITWVLVEQEGAGFGGVGAPRTDTRTGSRKAMQAVKQACVAVTLPSTSAGASGSTGSSSSTLYDCEGRAAELRRLAARE